jgi:phage FluMu gp28-like protein
LNQLIWSIAWIDSAHSIEHFAKYVVTRDEHAPAELSEKLFPNREEKPYIWDFIDTVQREDLLACEKSRQLMVTWAMCLYCLWVAKFQKNRIVFVQSKKELDAANLVFNTEVGSARISFMESRLPDYLRSEVQWSFGKAVFDTGTWIWGIPEGGDQIRSYTVSLLFSDEFAFQPAGEEAWKAASASVKRGGKVVLVSSANNGAYMKNLIERF